MAADTAPRRDGAAATEGANSGLGGADGDNADDGPAVVAGRATGKSAAGTRGSVSSGNATIVAVAVAGAGAVMGGADDTPGREEARFMAYSP